MRSARRRGLASALSLTLLASLALAATPAATAAEINDGDDKVFVLNNNIENRKCGKYNFENLLAQVEKSSVYPDVITLQQVSGELELKKIIERLTSVWKVDYEGVLAFKDSETAIVKDLCSTNKTYQANAVLWRKGAFELATPGNRAASEKRWTANAKVKVGTSWSACKNVPEVVQGEDSDGKKKKFENLHRRSISVAVALKDTRPEKKKDHKVLVVASVHWPKDPRDQSDKDEEDRKESDSYLFKVFDAHSCLNANMDETEKNLNNLIGDVGADASKTVKIIGGDMNAKATQGGWWARATGTLGFIDPIAVNCKDKNMPNYPNCSGTMKAGSETNRIPLNDDHRTTQLNRIDYILIKNAKTTKAASTVKQPTMAYKKDKVETYLYSNHRAVRATVKY